MNHSIKINRSKSLAPHLPTAQGEIDASISPMLIEQLAERAALDEGGVWDVRNSAFRELAPRAI